VQLETGPSHFHHDKISDMIHYKKFPFTEHQGELPCSEKPSRNSCHESITSNPSLQFLFINMSFGIIFKSLCTTIGSTMARIYAGRSGDQNLAQARLPSLLKNMQTRSSTHPISNSTKKGTSYSPAVK
jgi:hypothetical protein